MKEVEGERPEGGRRGEGRAARGREKSLSSGSHAQLGNPKILAGVGFLGGVPWLPVWSHVAEGKKIFLLPPPRANQVSSAPSHGHLTGVPCPRIHASTHLPVRHTGHSPAVASPEGTPLFAFTFASREHLVPPCSLYPATDWTATSRSCCRHPCLSSQSLLIAFSAQALGRIWLARKAVRRRFMRKKIGIPEKKDFPSSARLARLCSPQRFLSRHVLPLPRLLLN
jgi:hypothetical protein